MNSSGVSARFSSRDWAAGGYAVRRKRCWEVRDSMSDGVILMGRKKRKVSNRMEQVLSASKTEEEKDALSLRGGVYIPPLKLAAMGKSTGGAVEQQRSTWDALRKSINGGINKVSISNIQFVIRELFDENLVRGRGLFCRAVMKAQMACPTFTQLYAAVVSVVNTKFPEIGSLMLRRIVLQFRRAYKRNDKPQLLATLKFIAHLVNQQVARDPDIASGRAYER